MSTPFYRWSYVDCYGGELAWGRHASQKSLFVLAPISKNLFKMDVKNKSVQQSKC